MTRCLPRALAVKLGIAVIAVNGGASISRPATVPVSGTPPPQCTDPVSAEADRFAMLECLLERVNSGVYIRRSHYCVIPENRYCRLARPGRSSSPCACGGIPGRFS